MDSQTDPTAPDDDPKAMFAASATVHNLFMDLISEIRQTLKDCPDSTVNSAVESVQLIRLRLIREIRGALDQVWGIDKLRQDADAEIKQNRDSADAALEGIKESAKREQAKLSDTRAQLRQLRKELRRLRKLGEAGALMTLSELASYVKGYHDTGAGDQVTHRIAAQLEKANKIIALQSVKLPDEPEEDN